MEDIKHYLVNNRVSIIYNRASFINKIAAYAIKVLSRSRTNPLGLDYTDYYSTNIKMSSIIIGFKPKEEDTIKEHIYYLNPYIDTQANLISGDNVVEMVENIFETPILLSPMTNTEYTIDANNLYQGVYNFSFNSLGSANKDLLLDILYSTNIIESTYDKNKLHLVVGAIDMINRYKKPNWFKLHLSSNNFLVMVGTSLSPYDYLKSNFPVDGLISFDISATKNSVIKFYTNSKIVAQYVKSYLQSHNMYDTINDSESHSGYMMCDINIRMLLNLLDEEESR